MRTGFTAVVVLSFATGLCAGATYAQSTRSDPASKMNSPGMPGGLMNPGDNEKFRKADNRSFAVAKADSTKIVGDVGFPCEVTDTERIGHGHVTVAGRIIEPKAYEVARKSGSGYVLRSGGQRPIATSCLAADATHAAELAEGRKSDLHCQLPVNKAINATAGALFAAVGGPYAVTVVR